MATAGWLAGWDCGLFGLYGVESDWQHVMDVLSSNFSFFV